MEVRGTPEPTELPDFGYTERKNPKPTSPTCAGLDSRHTLTEKVTHCVRPPEVNTFAERPLPKIFRGVCIAKNCASVCLETTI